MAIVTGLALAGAAGWNAVLPLLILALGRRVSDRVPLGAPYDALASPISLVILLVLLPVELFADKVPGWDRGNDRIAVFYRPLAGALLMAATTRDTALPGILAAIIGAALAFGMHLLKTRYRHPLARILASIPTPIASLLEDLTVVFIGIAALLVPVLGLLLLISAAALAAWLGSVIRRIVARNTPATSAVASSQP